MITWNVPSAIIRAALRIIINRLLVQIQQPAYWERQTILSPPTVVGHQVGAILTDLPIVLFKDMPAGRGQIRQTAENRHSWESWLKNGLRMGKVSKLMVRERACKRNQKKDTLWRKPETLVGRCSIWRRSSWSHLCCLKELTRADRTFFWIAPAQCCDAWS